MSDRLATIVRAILKDKFIRAIGERKWTTQDEESINKLSDFFTEFDQRLTALEGWAETMGGYPIDRSGVKPKPTPIAEHTQEHCKIPGCIVCGGPTPATVERFTVFRYSKCSPQMGDTAIKFVRMPIGEVVAPKGNEGWDVVLPDGGILQLDFGAYLALVDMMLKSGVWERTNG